MTLWLEGACGIAGDMMVAALLDLGAPQAALDAALASLGVEGLETTVTRGASHGLAGVRFPLRGSMITTGTRMATTPIITPIAIWRTLRR